MKKEVKEDIGIAITNTKKMLKIMVKTAILIFAFIGIIYSAKTTGVFPKSIPEADAKSTSNQVIEKINDLLDNPSKKVVIETKNGKKFLYVLKGEYEGKESFLSKMKFWGNDDVENDKGEEVIEEKQNTVKGENEVKKSWVSKMKFWDKSKKNIE